MLICMKLSRVEIEDVRKRLRSALKKQHLTVTEIGGLAGVHPSQVGRICRGEFRTMSHNVVQVCRVLGLDPTVARPATESDAAWALLERNLRKLWEVSPDRAKQMARLLEAMAKLALR
jgi:transcriptional regulator with XRE-family HTH domain